MDADIINLEVLKRIKAKREKLSITKKDMATYLGYKDVTSYTNIEKGAKNLTIPQLVKICKKLDLKFSEVMGEEKEEPKAGSDLIALDQEQVMNFFLQTASQMKLQQEQMEGMREKLTGMEDIQSQLDEIKNMLNK